MKKSIIVIASAFALVTLCLMGCSSECNHKWEPANCESPQTCTKCGIAEGEINADAHMWNAADCQQPRTCARCGITDGEANPANHAWEDATCLVPMTCWKCGEQNGEVIGHKYSNGVCETCGITDPNAKTS